ncbi:MAG TPA: cytochrome b/b6 domain-containing protein [Allosphingosinicella sp.]
MDPTKTEARPAPAERNRVAVWDRPVRVVHWLFVILIPFSWWTAEEEMIEWHQRSGLALLGLLVFRIIWGLIGSSTARFASFVRGPGTILSYLRGRVASPIGHNPLGALSVLALLAVLAVQIGLGLFAADDDWLWPGPLTGLIGEDLAEELTEWHEWTFNLLLAAIALHVLAIAFYLLVKRRNLVGPMVTGVVEAPPGTEPMKGAGAVRFFVAAAAAFAVVSLVWMQA